MYVALLLMTVPPFMSSDSAQLVKFNFLTQKASKPSITWSCQHDGQRCYCLHPDIKNVNDEPPVCNPPHMETQIFSTVKGPFIHLNCSDRDSPQEHLSYSIIGGNTNNQFTLWRQGVDPPFLATRKNFQYDLFQGIQDPMTFQLLVEVTDELGGDKDRQLSATITVIVHVLPWTTVLPTSSTQTTTTTITTAVLKKFSYYWRPDNWLPAVLTLMGALFVLCLYAVAWCLFKHSPTCSRLFPECHSQKSPPSFTATEPPEVPSHQ